MQRAAARAVPPATSSTATTRQRRRPAACCCSGRCCRLPCLRRRSRTRMEEGAGSAGAGDWPAGGRRRRRRRRSARCAWRISARGTWWRACPARTVSTGPAPCPGSRPSRGAPSAAPTPASASPPPAPADRRGDTSVLVLLLHRRLLRACHPRHGGTDRMSEPGRSRRQSVPCLGLGCVPRVDLSIHVLYQNVQEWCF